MDLIRRVGGEVEPRRGFVPHRSLLPYELEICENIGITPAEYLEFFAAAYEYVEERRKEYELVPDVQNNPTTVAIVQLVIGLALTAVSALLAPKPRQPNRNRPSNLDIPSESGRTRYTKNANFDSVQQLASLGRVIPLVFAEQQKNTTLGGVRVDTDLLHSQIISFGNSQLFEGVFNISLGELGRKPDFDGYALGDLLLRDMAQYKIQLYFSNKSKGNRIKASDQYQRSKMELSRRDKKNDRFSVAAFSTYDQVFWPWFSGTRTPSTRTKFGAYSPVPNHHVFYIPYELVLVQDGTGTENKKTARAQRSKVTKPFPRYCGIVDWQKNSGQTGGYITYKIKRNKEGDNGVNYYAIDKNFESYKSGGKDKFPYDFGSWGLNDVNSTIDETRQSADEIIQLTEQYLIGNTLAVCTERPDEAWFPETREGYYYKFKFNFLDQTIPLVPQDLKKENGEYPLNEIDFLENKAFRPWEGPAIMRASIGNITNTRPCRITEIGIKSEVWRQMTNSANFQAHPTKEVREKFERKIEDDGGGRINLGTKTSYMSRWSFFELEARRLDGDRDPNTQWQKVAKHPFGVLGNTPTNQYNTIQITHPETDDLSVYEYRFVPVAGARFYDRNTAINYKIYHLNGRDLSKQGGNSPEKKLTYNGFTLRITGKEIVLGVAARDNKEWVFGGDYVVSNVGPITDLSAFSADKWGKGIPTEAQLVNLQGPYFSTASPRTVVEQGPAENQQTWYWGDKKVGDTTKLNQLNIRDAPGANTDQSDRKYRYTRESQIRPWLPERWEKDPPGSFKDFDLVPNSDGRLVFTPLRGVVTLYNADGTPNGRYDYYWGGKRVVRNTFGRDGFKLEYGNNSVRYRTQANINVDACFAKKSTFEPEEGLQNKFKWNENLNTLKTGAILVKDANGDERYDFYWQGDKVGETKLADRQFAVTTKPVEGRWYLEDLRQEGSDGTGYKELGSFRDFNYPLANPSANQFTINGVFRNIDGQYVYKWKNVVVLRNFSGNVVHEFTDQDGKQLRIRRDNSVNSINIGIGQVPCWPVVVEELQDAEPELWSISFRYKIEYPEICEVRRFRKFPAQNGLWAISRRRQLDAPKDPINPNGDEYQLIPTNANRASEITKFARVRVYLWYDPSFNNNNSPCFVQWELIERGVDYIPEEVKIGASNPFNITVTTTIEPKEKPNPIDKDPEYDAFVEDGVNYFPSNAVCDYFINNTDRTSHESAPEHEIAFVNEIIPSTDPNVGPQYADLALAGLKITNSNEWSNLSNLSVYVSRGVKVERLYERQSWVPSVDGIPGYYEKIDNGEKAQSNLFPEIAYALLTDSLLGAGDLVGAQSVDRESMAIAARFCEANGFYWDGVISETQNLREFIFEQAAYCMLDFTIKGGKFSLYPSVLFNTAYKITNAVPPVKALFTDGNMRNMQVSFLEPEERQRFQASVLYRVEKQNGFSTTATKLVRLASGSDADPVEQFDLTQFCTNSIHAEMFGKYAIANRVHITHGIKFETTPTAAANLEPGDYIRIATTVTHVTSSRSGSISVDGVIQSAATLGTATLSVIYWKPGTTNVNTATLSCSTNLSGVTTTSQANLFGALWCEELTTAQKILYKVETISFADDGLVEISASEAPTDADGRLKTVDWLSTTTLYQVVG